MVSSRRPYRRVVKSLPNQSDLLVGQTLRADVTHPDLGEQIAAAGTDVDETLAKQIAALPAMEIAIVPFVSDDMEYMSADVEDRYIIGQANAPLDEKKRFKDRRISSRYGEKFVFEAPERLDFMDIAPRQIVGISAGVDPVPGTRRRQPRFDGLEQAGGRLCRCCCRRFRWCTGMECRRRLTPGRW